MVPFWCCGGRGFASPLPNQRMLSWQQLRFMLQPKAAAEDLGTPTIAAIRWAWQPNAICNSFLPGKIALKPTHKEIASSLSRGGSRCHFAGSGAWMLRCEQVADLLPLPLKGHRRTKTSAAGNRGIATGFGFLLMQNAGTAWLPAHTQGITSPCFQARKNANQLLDKVILPSVSLSLLSSLLRQNSDSPVDWKGTCTVKCKSHAAV